MCIREDTFSNNAANRHPSRIGRWTPRDCRQIGQPIDTFQVLQHRMVGMYMELEQAIAAVYLAILHLADEPASRARAVSAAKTTIGRAARFHRAERRATARRNGMTEELAIGHYFKRLTAIQYEFGSADYHLARYAELTNPADEVVGAPHAGGVKWRRGVTNR